MAIKSMTGFGRGEFERGGRVWAAEIRCVNNRYLDLKMKLPRGCASLEEKIRKKVAETHLRGRVDLFLSVSGDFTDLQEVKINIPLAESYRNALQSLSDEFALESNITAQTLVSYPDVLIREQQDEDLAIVWEMVEKAIDAALESCDTMRSQEGKALAADLVARLAFFDKTIASIEESIPELLEQRQKHLQERLEKLLTNVQLDPSRLAQEVAIMADKTDVTEEIVRLRCHIGQFTLFLSEGVGIGRKLDFLIQEFLREVNTLASKINDATVAHLTVDLKSELEKMREQVQNIE
ncbi:MAG: YicC/YloC family endoribonuclease [Desulforhopalus sp.]